MEGRAGSRVAGQPLTFQFLFIGLSGKLDVVDITVTIRGQELIGIAEDTCLRLSCAAKIIQLGQELRSYNVHRADM
eukprot:9730079-Karenia_brevis.AAC.1